MRPLENDTALALGDPRSTVLRTWRCPSRDKSCRKPLVTLHSTPSGRVLRLAAPAREASTEEIKLRREATGAHIPGGGWTVYAEFVNSITDTAVTANCSTCGPQSVENSDLSLR